MEIFTRDDGRTVGVVPGFRDQVLAHRTSVTPRPHWSESDYAAAAARKLQRGRRLLDELHRWCGPLDGAVVLEVGCGDGLNCLLLALQRVRRVVGIDLHVSLFQLDDKGEQTRRLADAFLQHLDITDGLAPGLPRLPLQLATMDARRMGLPDESVDLLFSRSTLEHLVPIRHALAEMARVVRPGGLIRHSVDPYFWLRGCHKRGVVDIPWAHARLSPAEFRRFVSLHESNAWAIRRCRRLETLNHFTLRQWRALLEAGPWQVLSWKEEPSPLAQTLLESHPDVVDTLLGGIERHDLIHGRIEVWLRKNARGW